MSTLGTELVQALRAASATGDEGMSQAYVVGYLEGMVNDLARLPGAADILQYHIDRKRAEAAAQPTANKEA